MTPAFRHADLYSAVFSAANDAGTWEGPGMPTGAQVRLWQALDRLKDLKAPPSDVRSAEEMSITVHRLNLALRRTGAEGEVDRHRLELFHLTRQWLGQLPMNLSRGPRVSS